MENQPRVKGNRNRKGSLVIGRPPNGKINIPLPMGQPVSLAASAWPSCVWFKESSCPRGPRQAQDALLFQPEAQRRCRTARPWALGLSRGVGAAPVGGSLLHLLGDLEQVLPLPGTWLPCL